MNLQEAYDFTMKYRRSWKNSKSPETLEARLKLALEALGNVDCEDIVPVHYAMIESYFEGKKSAATINRVCSVVHTVCAFLYSNRKVTHVASFQKLDEPLRKAGFYTEDEIDLMLSLCPKVADGLDLQDSIIFACFLGQRQADLLGLTWDRVDMDNFIVTFTDTKDGTDYSLPFGGVPMVKSMIERRYADRINDTVFDWTDRHTLLRRFYNLKDLAGMNDDRNWHSLRHTCATWLLKKGASVHAAMSVLNHKTMTTTLRYAEPTNEAKEQALSIIAK